ncbi:MAG: zinc-dependent peptidase [Pseudomonadota bacterium]
MWRWLAGLLPGGGRRETTVDIPVDLWRSILDDQPELAGLDSEAADRLRGVAGRFLGGRPFYGGDGFLPDAAMQARIAALAALPVLELGEEWLDGVRSVVIYPDAFHVDHEEIDEAGVVHEVRDLRAGEAWEHGTLVLSWADVAAGLDPHLATSVVIHEVAHFLDGVNGAENGFPPLPRECDHRGWTQDFQTAFDRLNRVLDAGHEPAIDPYAATNPAEFFAVLGEYFFRLPDELHRFDPRLYGHLACFYHQDPLGRMFPAAAGERPHPAGKSPFRV